MRWVVDSSTSIGSLFACAPFISVSSAKEPVSVLLNHVLPWRRVDLRNVLGRKDNFAAPGKLCRLSGRGAIKDTHVEVTCSMADDYPHAFDPWLKIWLALSADPEKKFGAIPEPQRFALYARRDEEGIRMRGVARLC